MIEFGDTFPEPSDVQADGSKSATVADLSAPAPQPDEAMGEYGEFFP